MKDFFKKLNNSRTDVDDLDSGYDSEYYQGAFDSRDDRRSDDRRSDDRRSDDRPADRYDRFEQYDRRSDDRRSDDRYDRYDDRRGDDRRGDDRRSDDRRSDDRYDRYDDRRDDRYDDRRSDDRRSDDRFDRFDSREDDRAGAGYRERPETQAEAAPVFEPAPVPEYLYFTPASYNDCREAIVKGLASGHVVVVRLGSLEAGDVLRLFDYMMGAVLALDGVLARPFATTVVLLPKGVELDEEAIEVEDEDEDYDEDDYDEDEDEEYDDEDEYDEDDEAYDDYEDDEDGDYEEDIDEDVE